MRRIRSCGWAARGQTAAAPASPVMNSRRFMGFPLIARVSCHTCWSFVSICNIRSQAAAGSNSRESVERARRACQHRQFRNMLIPMTEIPTAKPRITAHIVQLI